MSGPAGLEGADFHDHVVPRLRRVLANTNGPMGGLLVGEYAEELYVLIQAIAADVLRQIIAEPEDE